MFHPFIIFFLFYAVGFAALAFLPRWWLFLPGALAAFALAVWSFNDLAHDDGPGLMMALPTVGCGAVGFLSGGLARALLLVVRGLRARVVLPLFFVGAPVVFIGWTTVDLHLATLRRAPPAPACSRETHPALLAGTALSLPLVPVLNIGAGREYPPAWTFSLNEDMRRFCADDPPEGLPITHLSIEFDRALDRYAPSVAHALYCTDGNEAWRPLMCPVQGNQETMITPPGVAPAAPRMPPPPRTPLTRMTVYALGFYDARKMEAFSIDEMPRLLDEATRYPATPLGGGIDLHTGDKYQVYLTHSNDPLFVARCNRSSNAGHPLHCSTGERLSSAIGLVYDFSTADADAAATIVNARRDALAIWESFRRR